MCPEKPDAFLLAIDHHDRSLDGTTLKRIPDSKIFDKDVEAWNEQDEKEIISRLRGRVEQLRKHRDSLTDE